MKKLIILFILISLYTHAQKQVIVQPYKGITKEYNDFVIEKLKVYLPNLMVNQDKQLPKFAYVNKRYRADSLLIDLKNKKAIVLGLTSRDITTQSGKYSDWGIFGLSYINDNASVVSTYRLKSKEDFYKVCIHELGHAFGLQHCPRKNCIMQDADSKYTMGQEEKFCYDCTKYLISKGWKIKP